MSSRLIRQLEKKTREEQMKERLRKIRQKRLLKQGYSLEDIQGEFLLKYNNNSNKLTKLIKF